MLIWNSGIDGSGICVRIVLLIVYLSNYFFWFIWGGACFAYEKIVITQWFSISSGPWTIFFKSIVWAALLCWHLMNNQTICRLSYYSKLAHRSVNVLSKNYGTLCRQVYHLDPVGNHCHKLTQV